MLVIENLPGKEMSADMLTKNLPGPLFARHAAKYVTDERFEEESKTQGMTENENIAQQQARESVGT